MKEKKLWFGILAAWIAVMILLSMVAPSSKEVSSPLTNSGLPEDSQAIEANKVLETYFPTEDGIPLFIVFAQNQPFSSEKVAQYSMQINEILAAHPFRTIDFSAMPAVAQKSFISEDEQTFFVPAFLTADLENKELKKLLDTLKEEAAEEISVEVDFTGPVGIISDTYEMFSKADVVLMLATIGVIFVILIVIYRSFILAILPLVGAAIAYEVVNRLIGLFGSADLFTVEGQALSIMMILLFAVITDYSLLLFARFKEAVAQGLSMHQAMLRATKQVAEPIFFSGGTVLMSMLTLFFAVYESYRNFAPVFAIAMIVMILAGLTLMPALFAIVGKRSVKVKTTDSTQTVWTRISQWVTGNPLKAMLPIIGALAVCIALVTPVNYMFNLLDSFPDDMSSVQGYERLSKAFSEGDIAPSTVIIESVKPLYEEDVRAIMEDFKAQDAISNTHSLTFTEDQKVAKFSLVFEHNPYVKETFDHLRSIINEQEDVLATHNIHDAHLWISGETAIHADIEEINAKDTLFVPILMSVLIFIMLLVQTRSFLIAFVILGSILTSFFATMGITVFTFQTLLGYEGISYRIPLYTFIFLVALGVDYSIMMVSRIKEEQQTHSFKEAVQRGLAKTGGVISSAGLILAATFTILITQPVAELRVFGYAVAVGIIIDTFLIRPIVIPALLVKLKK
ncbi:MAG: MMPL family transporter [Lysinibacillus sp.]